MRLPFLKRALGEMVMGCCPSKRPRIHRRESHRSPGFSVGNHGDDGSLIVVTSATGTGVLFRVADFELSGVFRAYKARAPMAWLS